MEVDELLAESAGLSGKKNISCESAVNKNEQNVIICKSFRFGLCV